MINDNFYVDAHSHWADPRIFNNSELILETLRKCFEKNIRFFLQGGVNPEDWLRQKSLKEKHPENFGLCFGIHPYFVSDHTPEECDLALDELVKVLGSAMAVGETGLDFRPHIMKENSALQIEIFEDHIELAKAFHKPVVLHIVQAHDKALQLLDFIGVPERTGFVHSYNGSYEVAKKFIDKGFLISVGCALTFAKNSKLRDCIKKMPLENLLIESDSPDQPPEGWPVNNSSSVFLVAEQIALIRNLNVFEVLEINTSNFKRLFRL